MKTSELEALVIKQGEHLQNADARIASLEAQIEILRETTVNLTMIVESMAPALDDLTAKVEGRNKSAAVKRNMTDADAVRVLSTDLIELGHKEAAEKLGLTYAQVYSCRLGFTFKHVIRDLEKNGWRNRWAKG